MTNYDPNASPHGRLDPRSIRTRQIERGSEVAPSTQVLFLLYSAFYFAPGLVLLAIGAISKITGLIVIGTLALLAQIGLRIRRSMRSVRYESDQDAWIRTYLGAEFNGPGIRAFSTSPDAWQAGGLAVNEPDGSISYPTLLDSFDGTPGVSPDPLGAALLVQLLPGQTAEDVERGAPSMAAYASRLFTGGVRRVEVHPHEVHADIVRLVLVVRDPLAQSQSAVFGSASAQRFVVPLGRMESGEALAHDWSEPWHLGLQGQTRSGKSVACYSLLGQISERSDVLVTGVDPTGLLLGPWAAAPGAQWRQCGTENVERAAEALSGLVAEMDRRIAALRSGSLGWVDALKPEQHCSADLPLVIVVLEEYAGLLEAARLNDAGRKPAERLAPQIEGYVSRLLAESAKVAMRVAILVQRADASIIGGAQRSNIAARYTLRVDNLDAVKMFHPRADMPLAERVGRFPSGMCLVERPDVTGLARFNFAGYPTYAEHVSQAAARRASDAPARG